MRFFLQSTNILECQDCDVCIHTESYHSKHLSYLQFALENIYLSLNYNKEEIVIMYRDPIIRFPMPKHFPLNNPKTLSKLLDKIKLYLTFS